MLGSLLITLLRHTDRVSIACLAQLVNVIAPIMTEPGGPAWRQTIFHPFALTARYARGTVLQTPVSGPTVTTDRYGEVDQVHAVATWDEQARAPSPSSSSTARSPTRSTSSSTWPASVADLQLTEHLMLSEDHPTTTNTHDHPDRVRPRPGRSPLNAAGVLTSQLPRSPGTASV